MKEWQVSEDNAVVADNFIPVSHSALSQLTECPLHFAFTRDRRYPPRLDPRARMGIAFHEALAFVAKHKPVTVSEAVKFLDDSLRRQRNEALLNYRERRLAWPQKLWEAMENVLALRVCSMNSRSAATKWHSVEDTLLSPDGVLVGRPDEILMTDNGPVIVDYKTGRFSEENLDHAEEQIHFYAGLWEELHSATPKSGRIEFLVENRHHSFTIDPKKAKSLLRNARNFAGMLRNPAAWLFKPNLGSHCRLCDYRPWCTAYWSSLDPTGIGMSPDIAGVICNVHPRDSQVLCLCHESSHITIVNKDLDLLPTWGPGTPVRALALYGEGATRFRTNRSELFYVVVGSAHS